MHDPSAEGLEEQYDNPLERLQLLGSDDEAIAAFLDEIDVRGPRDRELLRELARSSSLARSDRFEADHRRLLVGLESLRRHGHHGARAAESLGVLRTPNPLPDRARRPLRRRVVRQERVDESAQPLLDARDGVGARLA
jgi:hypothetical protein